jgi:hypothetical protein
MPLCIPQTKKRTALMRELKKVFRGSRSQPVQRVMETINPMLSGWVGVQKYSTRLLLSKDFPRPESRSPPGVRLRAAEGRQPVIVWHKGYLLDSAPRLCEKDGPARALNTTPLSVPPVPVCGYGGSLARYRRERRPERVPTPALRASRGRSADTGIIPERHWRTMGAPREVVRIGRGGPGARGVERSVNRADARA